MAFWSPWEELNQLQRRLDRLFETPFFFDTTPAIEGKSEASQKRAGTELATSPLMRNWRPVCDVKETDQNLVVHAELPGVPKERVKVEFDNNILTISGERTYENKVEGEKWHRTERSYGKFSRSIAMPEGVDPAQISATYKDGVLEVTVPKPADQQKKHVEVKIN
jgi:HSP20 family protein